MKVEKYLEELKAVIDKGLDRYLPKGITGPVSIHKAMRYSVFPGGKRIRPIIVLESARACGAGIKKALPAACAVELIHAYSLVHDDLPSMDDASERRGKPSCHKKFGEANAILCGDALLTLAFEILAEGLDKNVSRNAVTELSKASGSLGMVGGQVLDLEYQGLTKDKKTLALIHRLKTGRLFEASAKLGAIAAGAGKREIDAMLKYGSSLGLAFQITDDILDNDDYAALAGRKCAMRDAAAAINKAKGALGIFGKKAGRLKDIADLVIERVR